MKLITTFSVLILLMGCSPKVKKPPAWVRQGLVQALDSFNKSNHDMTASLRLEMAIVRYMRSKGDYSYKGGLSDGELIKKAQEELK